MSVVRAFIAIELSPEIYERLDHVINQLKDRLSGMPIRWVHAKNIHLTIKFLGDVSVANLEMLENIILSEANCRPPFEVSIGELGAYPSLRRPRVIWVGIKAPPELTDFQRGVEAETARLGYTPEKRDFSPHLTLGRISRNASSEDVKEIGLVLGDCKVGFLGATRIESVYLFRSDLQPGGAVYSKLYSASFLTSIKK
ncbi:RNA 2',3'-cyclic phosphodiesterase [Chloroflexota bacterium]